MRDSASPAASPVSLPNPPNPLLSPKPKSEWGIRDAVAAGTSKAAAVAATASSAARRPIICRAGARLRQRLGTAWAGTGSCEAAAGFRRPYSAPPLLHICPACGTTIHTHARCVCAGAGRTARRGKVRDKKKCQQWLQLCCA